MESKIKKSLFNKVPKSRKKLKSMVKSKVDRLFSEELGILSTESIVVKERFISSSTDDLVS